MFSTMSVLKELYSKVVLSKDRKIVLENFLALGFWQIITLLVPLITIPYLVRVIGPAKYGLISFAQALVQYFVIFTDYGFNFSATRELAIVKEDLAKVSSIFNAVLWIKLLFLMLSFLVLCLICLLIPKFRSDWPVYLFSFGIVVGNVLSSVFFFQGMEKMRYISLLNLPGVIFVLAIFIFVKSEQDFIRVPLITSLGSVAVGILSLWTIREKFKIKFGLFEMSSIKRELKAGWSLFVSTLTIAGFTNTRVFALGLFSSHTVTGYYALAEKLMYLVHLFPLNLSVQAVYPRLSRIFSEDKKRAHRLIDQFQTFTTLVSLVVLPLLFIFAPWIIRVVSGFPYPEAILSFRLLMVATFFVGANAFRVHFLLMSGRSDIFARIHTGVGIFGTLLTLFLTYGFSYVGTAASFMVIAAIVLWLTVRYFKWGNQNGEVNARSSLSLS